MKEKSFEDGWNDPNYRLYDNHQKREPGYYNSEAEKRLKKIIKSYLKVVGDF